jgi:hypothetical protein
MWSLPSCRLIGIILLTVIVLSDVHQRFDGPAAGDGPAAFRQFVVADVDVLDALGFATKTDGRPEIFYLSLRVCLLIF